MLTPPRSAARFAVALGRIRCVVAEREDAPAEYLCVRSAVSSTAHGIVPARLRSQPVDARQEDLTVYGATKNGAIAINDGGLCATVANRLTLTSR
jgi:hypothetical protein